MPAPAVHRRSVTTIPACPMHACAFSITIPLGSAASSPDRTFSLQLTNCSSPRPKSFVRTETHGRATAAPLASRFKPHDLFKLPCGREDYRSAARPAATATWNGRQRKATPKRIVGKHFLDLYPRKPGPRQRTNRSDTVRDCRFETKVAVRRDGTPFGPVRLAAPTRGSDTASKGHARYLTERREADQRHRHGGRLLFSRELQTTRVHSGEPDGRFATWNPEHSASGYGADESSDDTYHFIPTPTSRGQVRDGAQIAALETVEIEGWVIRN